LLSGSEVFDTTISKHVSSFPILFIACLYHGLICTPDYDDETLSLVNGSLKFVLVLNACERGSLAITNVSIDQVKAIKYFPIFLTGSLKVLHFYLNIIFKYQHNIVYFLVDYPIF